MSFLKNGFLLSLYDEEVCEAVAAGGLVVTGDSVVADLEGIDDSIGCVLPSLERI